MKKKSPKTPYKPILQLCELVEIADPAEQAKVDRRYRAAEKALGAREAAPRKRPARKAK